jgi:sugar phosphate isomerase/epimerase
MLALTITPDHEKTLHYVQRVVAASGARLAVEFGVRGRTASIADALDVVAIAGGMNRASVVVDAWQSFRATSTGGARTYTAGSTGTRAVQRARTDLAQCARRHEDRRVLPGSGVFDLERFAHTLRNRGWECIVSVEVLNAHLRTLSVAQFAVRAHATTAPHWS